MVIFGFFITITLSLLGIIRGKSKTLFVLDAIWMWVLMGLNVGGLDYGGNEAIFRYTASSANDPSVFRYGINYFLTKFFHQQNLDFKVYTMVTVAVAVLIICYVVYKNCIFPATALSFFFIYPLFDSVIQKRFLLAMVICLLAFYFWLRKRIVIYYILIILSIGFHRSTIVYLFFAILVRIIRGKRKWLIIPTVGMLYFIFQNRNGLLPYLGNEAASKFDSYLMSINYSSAIVGLAFTLLEVGIITSMYFAIRQSPDKNGQNELLADWNLASVSFLPLLLSDSVFLRWYRLINIFNYIHVANEIKTIRCRKVVRFYLLLLFLFIIFWEGYMSFTNPDIIETVFKNNAFLIWLFR